MRAAFGFDGEDGAGAPWTMGPGGDWHRGHGPHRGHGHQRGDGHGRGPEHGRGPGPGGGPWGGPAGGPFGGQGPFGPAGPFGPGGPFEGPGGRGGRRGGGRRRRRGDVRLGILFLLAEEPRNGYGLIRELAERSGGSWRPSSGSVYPALSQLEDEGLVEPAEDAGHRYQRLTEAGRAEVERLGDRQRPWEEASEEAAGGESAQESWHALGQLAVALRAVVESGDEEAARRAIAELGETRKRLYGLLAGLGPDDSDEESAGA